jgi:hypothetical protein
MSTGWLRMLETPVERKWCWWTLARESGRWIYLFDNQSNKVIAKVFIWRWEEPLYIEEQI